MIYLLDISHEGNKKIINRYGTFHGTSNALVVRANSEDEARNLAAANSDTAVELNGEAISIWVQPNITCCVMIDPDGTPQVVCHDYIEE